MYQHQNGMIPKDLRRVALYCTGINKETLMETLNQRFVETEEGWYNEEMKSVIEQRQAYKKNQSVSGRIG